MTEIKKTPAKQFVPFNRKCHSCGKICQYNGNKRNCDYCGERFADKIGARKYYNDGYKLPEGYDSKLDREIYVEEFVE